MVRGTTEKGFEFEFDENMLNDMRFVDILSELEENPIKISNVVNFMFSKEQKAKLYEIYREKDGSVPVDAVTDAITEILKTKPETKNS